MHPGIRTLTTLSLGLACAFAAPATAQSTTDFRVLPYQLNPALDGIQLTWFTIANTPGTLTITGPGLSAPLVLASTPVLDPVLDYQIAGELNATGNFPFATTAIFEAPGVPARNWRHRVPVGGLQPDSLYTYTVTQGASTYTNTFRTAPTASTNRTMRFVAISDSETLVLGRTRFREWSATTPQTAASTGRPAGTGPGRNQYFLTETTGYRENLRQIELRNPDVLLMPGDLIEGTANECQRRWDEFWRHNAGDYDDLLGGRPLVAAIGNNCIYNGGGANTANPLVQYARQQWSAYFDYPANNDPAAKDLYFRTDYGPITILTLCSVGAHGANDNVAPPVGEGFSAINPAIRDTNRAWLVNYPYGDLPDFNIGTAQWDWAVQQLAAARAAGQIIFVQWHHTPYSRGIHGTSVTSNQSGEAMRIYAPLMEQYRVAGVFCGHSEVSEMSWFDLDQDGRGVFLWDVGAAGDGLRGVEDSVGATAANIANWRNNPSNLEGQAWTPNPYHVWSADQSEPETWNGNQLVSGGKHYGFLEFDVEPLANGEYRIAYQYWHNFPLNAGDPNFTVTGYELRPYRNRVELVGRPDDLRPVTGLYTTFGAGCAGSLGIPRLATNSQPSTGATLTVEVANLPTSSGLMITGFSNRTIANGTLSLPLSLATAGFPGCSLLVDPIAITPIFGSNARAIWQIAIPAASSLLGLQMHNQVMADTGTGSLAFSNGGTARIGN
jgi:3',5'-cyclic AMP phosphodiesterase CpdA